MKREINLFHLLAWGSVLSALNNWRLLHIDGFKKRPSLPLHTGVNRQFFQYTVPPNCKVRVIDVPKERVVSKPRILEAPYYLGTTPWPEQREKIQRIKYLESCAEAGKRAESRAA